MIKRQCVLITLLFMITMSGCTPEAGATLSPLAESPDPTTTAVFLPIVTRPPTPLSIPTALAQIKLPFQPGDMLSNPITGAVYVLAGGTHVAILDGTHLATLVPLPGTKARKIVLDPFGNTVYVAHDCEGKGCITTIQNGMIQSSLKTSLTQLKDIAIHPDNHLLYVLGIQDVEASSDARLLATNGKEVLGDIDLGTMVPNKIAVDAVYDHIYVGGLKLDAENNFSTIGSLVVINAQEESTELELGQAIVDILVNPDTGDAYVLQIPDYEGDTRLEDLTLVRDGSIIYDTQIEETSTADYLGIHPLTDYIYIVSIASQTVTIVRNLNDHLGVLGEAFTGSGAAKMAVDPHTGNVYFANFNDNTISVLNGLQTVATLQAGWYPYGISVNPQNGWVYVSNTNERTVSIFGYDE